MTGHNFFLEPVGGWMAPLPDHWRKEIELRWPEIPIHLVDREYGFYCLIKAAWDKEPKPAHVRAAFEDFQKQVSDMLNALETFRHNNLGSITRQMLAVMEQEADTLDKLIEGMIVFQAALRRTARYLPSGHSATPRQTLVANVAGLVEALGFQVDATPQGVLCGVVGSILSAADEDPTNLPSIVRPIVSAKKKTAQK